MTLNSFVAYVKQFWKNKPDASTPLSAERLTHMEEGIKGNSNAIETIAAAVVNQIVNDPDKIASMAALYAVNQKVTTLAALYSVNQKIGDVSKLPDSAVDVVTAIAKQNSNLDSGYFKIKVKTTTIVLIIEEFTFTNGVATKTLQSIFGNIPTYASGICQTKVEDSSVYNFTAVKDGNNLKIATAGSTFSGKKWVTMIIFGTA